MDLSEKEKLKLMACLNPDDPVEGKYELGPGVEQSILATMMADRHFLVQAIDLVKPGYFISDTRELICECLISYNAEYKQIPPFDYLMAMLVEKAKGRKRPMAVYEAELKEIRDSYEPEAGNREFLLDQVEEFAKQMAMREAVMKIVDSLFTSDKSKWAKIEEMMKAPFLISRQQDFGLDYFNEVEDRYERKRRKELERDIFTMGFPDIDKEVSGGGGSRGELYGFVGSSGTGKSLLLAKASIANVVRGRKVLFISLEMDQDKVGDRFDSMFCNIPKDELLPQEAKVVRSLNEIAHQWTDRKRLVVKRYPGGQADVNTFRACHAQLRSVGFVPDMVVTDYVGEMKDQPGMKTYESRYRICRDLRAWGVEANHFSMTALQPNRSARGVQEDEGMLRDDHLADSYDQIRVFDAMWAAAESKNERAMSLLRLGNLKMRDGKAGQTHYLQQNPLTLDFEDIGQEKYKEIMSLYRQQASEDVKIDGGGQRRYRRNAQSNDER